MPTALLNKLECLPPSIERFTLVSCVPNKTRQGKEPLSLGCTEARISYGLMAKKKKSFCNTATWVRDLTPGVGLVSLAVLREEGKSLSEMLLSFRPSVAFYHGSLLGPQASFYYGSSAHLWG